jgi:hypothetical protein
MDNKNLNVIGKYVNRHGYSDHQPVGKVVAIKGSTLIMNPVTVGERLTTPLFEVGGFAGNCTNNDEIDYNYNVDESSEIKLRWCKSRRQEGYYLADYPFYKYDYNF